MKTHSKGILNSVFNLRTSQKLKLGIEKNNYDVTHNEHLGTVNKVVTFFINIITTAIASIQNFLILKNYLSSIGYKNFV